MKGRPLQIQRIKLNSQSHRNLAKVLKEKSRGMIEEIGDFKLKDITTPDGRKSKIVRFEATKKFKELLK